MAQLAMIKTRTPRHLRWRKLAIVEGQEFLCGFLETAGSQLLHWGFPVIYRITTGNPAISKKRTNEENLLVDTLYLYGYRILALAADLAISKSYENVKCEACLYQILPLKHVCS